MDDLFRQIVNEIRGAWRFRWLAMATAWIVGLGGIALALFLPDEFEAKAQVFVDTTDPIENSARGSDGEAQIKVFYVRRLLLSTPNLEQVARETDLDLRAATPREFEELIADLQKDIQVTPGGGRGPEANVYTILYRDRDRRTAERVVQVLLNTFQEGSIEGDLREDLQALRFLDGQMQVYRERLEEAESRVARFKRDNAGLLPGEGGGFFNRLSSLQDQLRQVRTDLVIAQNKRSALAGQVQSNAGGGDAGSSSLNELEAQVLQAQKDLDRLRLVYTDEHPSVISAQETLAALDQRLENKREELGPLLGSGAGGAVIDNVRIALAQAEVDVTELRAKERDLAGRVAELEAKVNIAPQLEAELAGLVRDYEVLRNYYEQLLGRREQLSFEIDRKKQGRQLEFRIIEPPLAPQLPVAPDRFRILLMSLAAALAAGAGIAFVIHQLRPVYISGQALYEDLQIPVLGAISLAWTARERRIHRFREVAFVAGIGLLVATFAVLILVLPSATQLAQRMAAA